MNKWYGRTDLALENKEWLQSRQITLEEGVLAVEKKGTFVTLTEVEIQTPKASEQMGKPMGRYWTIEGETLKENHPEALEEAGAVVEDALKRLMGLKGNETVLVVGLGNWNVTPDALGPKVVQQVFVTRHLQQTLPKELAETFRPLAAVSPGVMGLTGLETGEMVRGIVQQAKPDVVLAVDALAARKFSRINTTIQLSDTGIAPGSGVGNKRMALSKETLGVPVFAIGVPTVVDAATLVYDTLALAQAEESRWEETVEEVLVPYASQLFVTPKEMDAVVDRLAATLASAINAAVHPNFKRKDQGRFFH